MDSRLDLTGRHLTGALYGRSVDFPCRKSCAGASAFDPSPNFFSIS
jgi:hypothetical protein